MNYLCYSDSCVSCLLHSVISKLAAYVVLEISEGGHKEVLSIIVGENESGKYWLSILNSLKNRGV